MRMRRLLNQHMQRTVPAPDRIEVCTMLLQKRQPLTPCHSGSGPDRTRVARRLRMFPTYPGHAWKVVHLDVVQKLIRRVAHSRSLGYFIKLPPLLSVAQPLRHLLVAKVRCPALGGGAPAIVLDRHVDAAVDEELHGFVVLAPHELVQDINRRKSPSG